MRKRNDCGKARFPKRSKIRGGQRAIPGSIPWQILLRKKSEKKTICGGSLLNARWGITAAHCLKYYQIFDIEIGLGVFNWRISKKREQYVSIDEVHIHPQYNENTFDSDIALFHFETDVIMTDYIQPICLPVTQIDQALLRAGNIGVISGWGAKKVNKQGRTHSVKKLHEVELPLVSQVACEQNHWKYVDTQHVLCWAAQWSAR